jgi:hypothetical protein
MPAFSQNQLSYSARTGNTTTVLIGAQPIAFAQTVSHTFDLGAEQLYGIGSAKPQETQQLKVAPQITVDNFALTSNGQQLIESLGSSPPLSSLLANNSFNISIIDGNTGNALFTYVGCVASNYNMNIPANQPVTEAITFMAQDVLDGTGQSILNGPNALNITTSVLGAITNALA